MSFVDSKREVYDAIDGAPRTCQVVAALLLTCHVVGRSDLRLLVTNQRA